MQTDNRLFDDLARIANGALHTMSGVRDEVETRLRERLERWLTDMDMVPREEFEAIKAVAQAARTEQEKLFERVDLLEKQVAALTAAKPARAATSRTPARPKKTAKPRSTTKAKRPD